MSSKAADLLLALNSQVRHEPPEENINQNKTKPNPKIGKKGNDKDKNKKAEMLEELPPDPCPVTS